MKHIISVVFSVILLTVPALRAQTTSGEITTDETWSGTITISGDIVVKSGVLTIEPGTVVKFATTNDNVAVTDNKGNVFGNAGQIFFGIETEGCVKAIGTPSQPITFTTTSLFPVSGSWGQIHPMGLNNDPVTEFRHCIFEYNRSGIGMRNDAGLDQVSAPIIDYCTFRHFTNSGVYCSSGGAPTITNCTFEDVTSAGIFLHGGNDFTVRNCSFRDLSVAVINSGLTGYDNQNFVFDHCVIHDIDMMKATTIKWWTGYGIFNANWDQINGGSATITNSIISETTLGGMMNNQWNVSADYNCYYNNLASIDDGEIGAHSLEADPLFTDPDNGDFTLKTGSPCIGAGSDGYDIGLANKAIGATASIGRLQPDAASFVQVEASPNPLHSFTEIRFAAGVPVAGIVITTPTGTPVRHIEPAADGIFWNGRNDAGERVMQGVYIVQLAGTGGHCRVVVR